MVSELLRARSRLVVLTAIAAGLAGCSSEATRFNDNRYSDNRYSGRPVALVEPTPKELRVLAKASVLQNTAWTPPTLAGTKLYLRDRKNLVALDLAAK